MPEKEKLVRQVRDLADRLRRAPEHAGETFAQRLDNLGARLSSSLRERAAAVETRLARLEQRLAPLMEGAANRASTRLLKVDRCLLPALKDAISKAERGLSTAIAKLELLDPGSPLKRGYSLTFGSDGRIVRSVNEVAPGAEISTRLGDGVIRSEVLKQGLKERKRR